MSDLYLRPCDSSVSSFTSIQMWIYGAIVVAAMYLLTRHRHCCTHKPWSAETPLRYSWPMKYTNYYGDHHTSDRVGRVSSVDQGPARQAEVPAGDRSKRQEGPDDTSPFGQPVYLMDMSCVEMKEYLLSGLSKKEQSRIFSN